MDNPIGNLKSRYENLKSNRTVALERARVCAKYTVPTLLPPEGASTATKLKVTYSSYGARAVNSLTSKLVLALFPPKAPFFKLVMPDEILAKLGDDPKLRTNVEEALGKMEQRAAEEIETSLARPTSVEAVKHLIVAGNVLTRLKEDNSLKVFALSNYVVKRDPEGNLLAVVALEKLSAMEVPEGVRVKIRALDPKKVDSPDDTLELYTGVFRTATGYDVWQEVEGFEVPGSRGTYPLDSNPWTALRWNAVDGEDYGRGLVEDYLGDLVAVEGLTAAIVKGSAAAAKLVFLVDPSGVTKKSTIAKAETGDVVDGKEQDVTTLQSQKAQDFQTAFQTRQSIMDGLAYAFLMNTAIQRDAERVTAEEIRFMANELDTTLGGIYSSLSMEFQLPYVRRLLVQLQRQGKLPMLPKGSVKPVIITGIEALGRGADLDKLRMFVKDVVELGGPEALGTYVDFGELMKRLAVARQIKVEGLVKKQEDVDAEQEYNDQRQMAEKLGPQAIAAAGGMAKQAMQQPQGAPIG